MRQKVIWYVLSLGCIALAGVSGFLYMNHDRAAPVIHIEEQEITYTEGDNTQILLEGVTAEDEQDGDLTEKIFVDKMIVLPNADGTASDQAIVKYAVMDKSKNIGTAKRTVSYIPYTDKALQISASDETKNQEEVGKEQAEELLPNGENPAIRLTTHTMTIHVGTDFDTMSVVENAVDDADGREELYAGIHLEGDYDTTVPGTYALQYYVIDSSGNQSNIEDFVLIVE